VGQIGKEDSTNNHWGLEGPSKLLDESHASLTVSVSSQEVVVLGSRPSSLRSHCCSIVVVAVAEPGLPVVVVVGRCSAAILTPDRWKMRFIDVAKSLFLGALKKTTGRYWLSIAGKT